MNAAWHKAHPMPKRPTYEQRLEWHREHDRACGCRKPPPEIAAAIARTTPRDGHGLASDR